MTLPIISPDDPGAPDVLLLLEAHLAFANAHSPAEDVHALDIEGLRDPAVSFFSLRSAGQLAAVGALKRLDAEHVELKSMHTAEGVRGQGFGRAMLAQLLDIARKRAFRRVSLETGSMAAFEPARSLYASAGFVECDPFGDYVPSAYSTFFTMSLGC